MPPFFYDKHLNLFLLCSQSSSSTVWSPQRQTVPRTLWSEISVSIFSPLSPQLPLWDSRLLFIPGGSFELNHIAPTRSHLGTGRINECEGRPADGWGTKGSAKSMQRNACWFKKKSFPSRVSHTESNDEERLSAGWVIVLSCSHLRDSLQKPLGLWESGHPVSISQVGPKKSLSA